MNLFVFVAHQIQCGCCASGGALLRLIFFVDNLVVVKGLLSRIELWHIYLGKPLQAIRECILIRNLWPSVSFVV